MFFDFLWCTHSAFLVFHHPFVTVTHQRRSVKLGICQGSYLSLLVTINSIHLTFWVALVDLLFYWLIDKITCLFHHYISSLGWFLRSKNHFTLLEGPHLFSLSLVIVWLLSSGQKWFYRDRCTDAKNDGHACQITNLLYYKTVTFLLFIFRFFSMLSLQI